MPAAQTLTGFGDFAVEPGRRTGIQDLYVGRFVADVVRSLVDMLDIHDKHVWVHLGVVVIASLLEALAWNVIASISRPSFR